jgi:FAD/FMN-containing dehydrogenase
MTATQQISALAAADCDVAFDNLTRQLYATDASLYQVEPVAVAFPRNVSQAAAIIRAAADAGLEIIPRGAGTGLAGGAVGAGVVVDFSRPRRGPGPAQRLSQTARFSFRAGRGHQFARHFGRHDRQ